MIATFGSDLLPPPPTTFATVSDDGLISLYDASSGELVPVGRWVDGTLVPLAAAPGWVSADGGERVIVHHF